MARQEVMRAIIGRTPFVSKVLDRGEPKFIRVRTGKATIASIDGDGRLVTVVTKPSNSVETRIAPHVG